MQNRGWRDLLTLVWAGAVFIGMLVGINLLREGQFDPLGSMTIIFCLFSAFAAVYVAQGLRPWAGRPVDLFDLKEYVMYEVVTNDHDNGGSLFVIKDLQNDGYHLVHHSDNKLWAVKRFMIKMGKVKPH